MKKYLLFDLDGTLTDPKRGICTCVQYALEAFGIHEPDLDRLEPFIGPPLKESFMEFYHMEAGQAEAAVEKYRERFREKGIFENKVYRGIPAMLRTLQARGMVLAVASSKPTVFVRRILEHFRIDKYFSVVVGSELDGARTQKDQVVKETLRQMFQGRKVERAQVYMIGDRRFDVEGARAAGVESVGVTYGYGGMEELKAAGADYIVRSVEELERFLLRESDQVSPPSALERTWQVMLPFLLFYLARALAVNIGVMVLSALESRGHWGELLFVRDASGALQSLTANASALLSVFGFAAGGAAAAGMARKAVRDTWEQEKLWHLRPNPPGSYLLLGMASLGLVLGLNLFLELSGITGLSQAYQSAAGAQHGAWLPLGLFAYGIVSPLAEELVFRGAVYGRLRCSWSFPWAAVLSAALFAVYHGNLVQGIYAFVMGLFLAYAYGYTGRFLAPAAIHMTANLLAYGAGAMGADMPNHFGWAACTVCLVWGGGSVWLLHRRKYYPRSTGRR